MKNNANKQAKKTKDKMKRRFMQQYFLFIQLFNTILREEKHHLEQSAMHDFMMKAGMEKQARKLRALTRRKEVKEKFYKKINEQHVQLQRKMRATSMNWA